MKRIYSTLSIILTLIAGSVLLLSWNDEDQTMYSTGAPAGYAGDPAGGNNNCSDGGCHTDFPATFQPGMITSDIPSGGYTPLDTYLITATIVSPINPPYGVKFGFEVAAQNITGTADLGTILLINTNETQIKPGTFNSVVHKYITHKFAGTAGSGGRVWTFKWVAPATGLAPVYFYGAFNETDNNNDDLGDNIYISTLGVGEWFLGVDQANVEPRITIFPTVSNGAFTIQNNFKNGNYDLSIYNVAGEVVLTRMVDAEVETVYLNVPSGIYFVSMKSGDTNTIRKIVIE